MKHNVGSYDAGARFVAGLIIIFIGVVHESWWGLVGLVPILTAALAYCPLYSLLHVDTTASDNPHPH